MSHHPEVTTAELVRAYQGGMGLKELARRYPLCRTAILYRLRAARIAMRPTGAPLGNRNARRKRP